MSNLNEFNRTVKKYVGHRNDVNEIVIDCRPDAIVGEMLRKKPKTYDECDDYITALIAGIAEVLSFQYGWDVEDTALYVAKRLGMMIAEIITKNNGMEDWEW